MPRSLPYWVASLLFTGLVLAKFDAATGFSSLLRFGETWQTQRHPALADLPLGTVPGSAGYDGQFYVQVALDPTLRDPALVTALDAPAYRARRILLPALAHGLGLGRPAAILQIYALLNVAAWFALAVLLRREVGGADPRAFARWLGCLFSMGVLESARQSLVDLPALLLLGLALRAHRAAAPGPTTLWLTLGHLTRETNLLASLALLVRPRPTARVVAGFCVACAPLAAWWWYARAQFPATTPAAAGNLTWPLVGALGQASRSIQAVAAGNFDSRHTFALLALVGLFTQAGVLWRHRQPEHPWWRVGAAYSLLLLLLGPWVWSGYWAACRAVLPLTIAFNLLLPPGRAFWPLWVAGNLTALHALWRFL